MYLSQQLKWNVTNRKTSVISPSCECQILMWSVIFIYHLSYPKQSSFHCLLFSGHGNKFNGNSSYYYLFHLRLKKESRSSICIFFWSGEKTFSREAVKYIPLPLGKLWRNRITILQLGTARVRRRPWRGFSQLTSIVDGQFIDIVTGLEVEPGMM